MQNLSPSKGVLWTGRVLVALSGLGLLFSAAMKLMHPADFMTQWSGFGFSESLATPVAIVEIACALLYLLPQTAVLGTLLVVAYMGGATVTHLRIADPFIIPVVYGVVAVAGTWLREPRLRALLPLRR